MLSAESGIAKLGAMERAKMMIDKALRTRIFDDFLVLSERLL